MIKLIPPILARGARRLSVSAVRPSTKSSVPQSLITNHMTERCQDLATISPSQPSLNPVLLIRCVHRPEKSVSYLKYHRFISFFLSYFAILLQYSRLSIRLARGHTSRQMASTLMVSTLRVSISELGLRASAEMSLREQRNMTVCRRLTSTSLVLDGTIRATRA